MRAGERLGFYAAEGSMSHAGACFPAPATASSPRCQVWPGYGKPKIQVAPVIASR